MKNDLEIKAEEIASLNISLSTQQKLIQEHEKEVAKIKYQLNQAEKSACKMDEIQNKMVDQEDEIQKLKVSQQSNEKELQDKDKVIQILRQELEEKMHFLHFLQNIFGGKKGDEDIESGSDSVEGAIGLHHSDNESVSSFHFENELDTSMPWPVSAIYGNQSCENCTLGNNSYI